jgi:hypothetical protein
MHVVIGLIGALAGLAWALVALRQAGISLDALNPFLWHRRARWRSRSTERPIYALAQPLEVAALLLLGVAKCEGEISAQQKQQILRIYRNDFHLGADEASDLLLASAFLLRDEIYLVDHPHRILGPAGPRFTPQQVVSLLSLMRTVASLEDPPNQEQERLIQSTREYFAALRPTPGWT